MSRIQFKVAALLVLTAFVAASASADFIYTSQNRYVTAKAYVRPTQTFTATDYAPFNATATSHYVDPWDEWYQSTATASQTSALTPTSISTQTSANVVKQGQPWGESTSYFRVTFNLPASAAYTMTESHMNLQGWWSLTGPALDYTSSSGPVIPSAGILSAGDYTLWVQSLGQVAMGQGIGGSSSFTLTIQPPLILGDINSDDLVNALDIKPFDTILTYYGAYQTEADINQDGLVNSLDVSGFVTCLINGGCGQIVGGAGLAPIPEPSSLFALAAVGLFLQRRRLAR